MRITKKQLRKLILKEFKDLNNQFIIKPPQYGNNDGGSNFHSGFPPVGGDEDNWGRESECENEDSQKFKNAYNVVMQIFDKAYYARGGKDAFNFLASNGYEVQQLSPDAEVYLASDMATWYCKRNITTEKIFSILTNAQLLFDELKDY